MSIKPDRILFNTLLFFRSIALTNVRFNGGNVKKRRRKKWTDFTFFHVNKERRYYYIVKKKFGKRHVALICWFSSR